MERRLLHVDLDVEFPLNMAGLILYPLGAALGLLLSAWSWERAVDQGQQPTTPQKHAIFLGCLLGMALGAKLGFVLAEGYGIMHDPRLSWSLRGQALLHGKTVTGALLGAYAGVELAKRRVGYRFPTGDRFALLAPLSLTIGRLGCLAQGCCLGRPLPAAPWTLTDSQGVARWPAVPLEFAFNLVFLVWVGLVLRRRKSATRERLYGQLFHVYLITYGAFRFGHEFLRDTPRLLGPLSGYHALAIAIFMLGAVGFAVRARARPMSFSQAT